MIDFECLLGRSKKKILDHQKLELSAPIAQQYVVKLMYCAKMHKFCFPRERAEEKWNENNNIINK